MLFRLAMRSSTATGSLWPPTLPGGTSHAPTQVTVSSGWVRTISPSAIEHPAETPKPPRSQLQSQREYERLFKEIAPNLRSSTHVMSPRGIDGFRPEPY